MSRKRVGERLRDLRGDKRPEEVALAVGVSASSVLMYERGERMPKDEVKLALSKYYEVPVGELFFAEDAHSE